MVHIVNSVIQRRADNYDYIAAEGGQRETEYEVLNDMIQRGVYFNDIAGAAVEEGAKRMGYDAEECI